MAADDQRRRLFIVHRHATERHANVVSCRKRVRVAVWAHGVHVDQTHLNGAKRLLQISFSLVALVVRQPLPLGAPVDAFRFPAIDAATGEAERLEAHRFHGNGSRKNHQVAPRNPVSVLLLDRPEQPLRLVEVGVVGPAIQGCEALHGAVSAAAAVAHSIGAGAVPGHANEKRAIVTKVRRPPILRGGHQDLEVSCHGIQVEAFERFGVVEVGAQRVGGGRVVAKRFEVQAIWPPVVIRYGFVLGNRKVRCHQRRRTGPYCCQNQQTYRFLEHVPAASCPEAACEKNTPGMRTIEQRDQIHASNRLELHRLILQSSSVPSLHLPGPVDMYPERRTVACHPACGSAIQGVDRQRIMPGANQHTALRLHHMQKRKSVMPPRREIAGKAKREGSGRSEMAARFWKRRRMEKSMLPGRNTCGRCSGFPSKGPSRYRW